MLAESGIAIDTSVRANFDYGAGEGPDFRHHPLVPYWLDDARTLLELPLTTVFWGMLRQPGRVALSEARAHAACCAPCSPRLGLLERIPLTPEGVTVDEAIRGIDIALDDGLPLLVLSFHSPSLRPGHTPYVRDEDDLDALYDWWRRVFAYLELRRVKPTTCRGDQARRCAAERRYLAIAAPRRLPRRSRMRRRGPVAQRLELAAHNG